MLKRIFSAAFFSVASRFFSTGTNLIIIFFISRFLDADSLGQYGIAFFFFQLFIVTSYFGLEVFLGKEVAHKREKPGSLSELFSETLSAAIYGTIISLFLMLVFVIFYHRMDFTLMVLALAAGILYGLERNLGGFLLGREKVHIDAFYMFLSLLVTVVLILIYRDSLNIPKIFLIRVFSLLIGVTGRVFAIAKDLPFVRLQKKIAHFREIKFFWFFTGFTFLERQADLFVLSLFIDEKILGGYFLSLRIYLTVNLLIEVVAQALTPFISRVFRGKEAVGFRTFFNYLFFTSLLVGIILGAGLFFTRDFIISLFNENLIPDSSSYLVILAFVVPFKVSIYMLGSILSSSRYQKARFYISLFTTLSFVISLIFLVESYSVFGAVYARAGLEVLTFFVSLIFVIRITKGYFYHEGHEEKLSGKIEEHEK
ncbi:MAG: oligosaccharide flippase family protein [Candidatus Aminicenantes bacterium]|nr:oligosaccharide flippase family protein [Candidatus Aminicenantes bacterium]